MATAWAYGGGPPTAAAAGTVTLVEGATFCVCGRSGDIHRGAEEGLFYRDTRFLSSWTLTLDGHRVQPLAVTRPTPYAGVFVSRRPPQHGVADSTVLVERRRYVGNGMLEQITVDNLGLDELHTDLAIDVAGDFADLFAVKEARATVDGQAEVTASGSTMHLQGAEGDSSHGVTVTGTGDVTVRSNRLTWSLTIAPRESAVVSVLVTPAVDGVPAPARYALGEPVEQSEPAALLEQWRRDAPVVDTPYVPVARLLARSAEDIGALRIFDADHPDRAVVAAGAPWFMTLFGRDSLLTSWMLLPVDPSLALGTLRTLAELQGTRDVPVTEEEPGRILHEIRSGSDSKRALGGGTVYYGSVDATPLFVMLLGELRRWGLGRADVDDLLPHADRALQWIVERGDRDGDGFVEYERRTDTGLVNQGWKDSFDAISFADGTMAEAPIALAEVQGYAYAAFVARAHFAREAGDRDLADEWAHRARSLKRRFNEVFWLPDRGHYALALDRDKRPVDALASNMAHCLWTGIVAEEHAPAVVRHLLGEEMFTGFGIRTLATSCGAYNPMSYHNGSVWPHDNAIAVAGLARYGFTGEAQLVTRALVDASRRFGGRLPELFCGFDRADYDPPIPYPTSCSPQAWAAAAPLLLLRSLLRFDPWMPARRVWCEPSVPSQLLPLHIERVHLAGASVTLDVAADGAWTLDGLPDGVEVVRRGRQPGTSV